MNSGTVWYKLTKEDILNNSLWKNNLWFRTRIEDYPLEASINLDDIDGSFVYDGALYYMVTDYDPIMLNGREVDPIDIMDMDLSFEQLSQYVSEDVPSTVFSKITDSDINWDGIDIEDYAIKLLEDGYTLSQIAQDAVEMYLIEL